MGGHALYISGVGVKTCDGYNGFVDIAFQAEGQYRFSAFWLRSKCSICSYQLNIWYVPHWGTSILNWFLDTDEMSGACSALVTGWPGIAVPPGSAHLTKNNHLSFNVAGTAPMNGHRQRPEPRWAAQPTGAFPRAAHGNPPADKKRYCGRLTVAARYEHQYSREIARMYWRKSQKQQTA